MPANTLRISRVRVWQKGIVPPFPKQNRSPNAGLSVLTTVRRQAYRSCLRANVVPWNAKQNAAVASFWYHQCRVAGQKIAVKNQMDALAKGKTGSPSASGHFPYRVGKKAGSVYHGFCFYAELPAVDRNRCIARRTGLRFCRFQMLRHANNSGWRGPVPFGGKGKIDQKPSVVKLSVRIENAAGKPFGFDGGSRSSVSFLDKILDRPMLYFPARRS